jgi:hypothetical protein
MGVLRVEVHRLQRENLELRQQVGYWKSRHRDALGRVTALEQKVEQLEGEKRQLCGIRSGSAQLVRSGVSHLTGCGANRLREH